MWQKDVKRSICTMMGTVLLHGDIWTVLAGVAFLLVVYVAFPITAIVLTFRYMRRKRRADGVKGSRRSLGDR